MWAANNIKMLTVKVIYLPLLLLLLRFDDNVSVAESTNERSFQSFYPFGYDAQDSFLHLTGNRCSPTVRSQFAIFQEGALFVSVQISILMLAYALHFPGCTRFFFVFNRFLDKTNFSRFLHFYRAACNADAV